MSNQITNFIINNIGLLVSLVIAVIGLVQAIISKKKQQVYANLYGFVSDAEQLVNASGLEKFTQVLDQAYNKLSPLFRFFISEDDIKRGIEYSLNKLEAYAQMQANTSAEEKSDNVAVNTNVSKAADLASHTVQETSSTPVANIQQ